MTITLDYEKLGLHIKELRINRKLTQENLSQMVDCNVSHISNIENNHTKVSLPVLFSIANALDVTIDYLLAPQYQNCALALDNAILKSLENCTNEKKERILKMIEIM